MIRVVQHRHKCIGCNACVEADPFRWRISRKDGKSVLIGGKEKKGWYSVLVDDDEQNQHYNGWTCNHYVSAVLLFCPDGTFPICCYNVPDKQQDCIDCKGG